MAVTKLASDWLAKAFYPLLPSTFVVELSRSCLVEGRFREGRLEVEVAPKWPLGSASYNKQYTTLLCIVALRLFCLIGKRSHYPCSGI